MAGTTQHELLIINDFYTCTCDEFLFDRIFEISGTTVIAYIYSLAESVFDCITTMKQTTKKLN